MVKKGATNRKKNKRTSMKKTSGRTKTIATAVVLGALCAFGLWQCIGGEDGSPLDPMGESKASREIDMGDQTPDPTLVNEGDLLKAEEATPIDQPRFEPPAETEGDDSQISIDEAGEAVEKEEEDEEDEEEALYPLHAVAYHFHTQVLAEPAAGSRVIGYARRGSTFRVSKRVSTRGCKRGWHELRGGGYICDGKGVNVSDRPVTFAPAPPKLRLDDPLPYDYKYAKEDGVPEFWRIPNGDEIEETRRVFSRIAARNKGEVAPPEKKTLADALARAKEIAAGDPRDGGVPEEEITQADSPEQLGHPDGGAVDPFALPAYVHLRLAKGYYVSTDDKVSDEERTYHRTVRGRLIPEGKLYPANPSELEGVLVNDRNPLPMVFVVGGGVKKLVRETEGGPLKAGARVKRYERLPFLGELKRKARRYVQVGENEFIPSRVAAVARIAEPPEDLGENERWIDIDLSEQVLVAYEGATPVFATLISSGRKDFDTPEGEFRIYGKHVTITMDDTEAGDEAYSIEDVPWTQYFDEGYALHAAFWHDRFGRVRSHGCVNLSPADARRLFFWTGPHVSPGLHGMIATADNPGTRVIIHK